MYALIYAKMYERTQKPLCLAKSRALFAACFATQEPDGRIYMGFFPGDSQVIQSQTALRHPVPCHAPQVRAIINLHDCWQILKRYQ
jgi:hypothetical protein